MKHNYQTQEQNAMRLELESYRGYCEMEKLYRKLIERADQVAHVSFIKEDHVRLQNNISYIHNKINLLPEKQRNFLYDVYLSNCELSVQEIMKKYDMSRASYHRFLSKAISDFAQLEDTNY